MRFFKIGIVMSFTQLVDKSLNLRSEERSSEFGSCILHHLEDSNGNYYGHINGSENSLFLCDPSEGRVKTGLDEVSNISRCSSDRILITKTSGEVFTARATLNGSPLDPNLSMLVSNSFSNDGTVSTAFDVLPRALALHRLVSWNELDERVLVNSRLFDPRSSGEWMPLNDALLTKVQAEVERRTPDFMDNLKKMRISRDNLRNVIVSLAHDNPSNPFLDRFKWVEWDGKPRIDNLLSDCGGVENEDYLRFVSKALILGTIQRQFEPVSIQCVPVLVGPTGLGKSTLLNRLAFSEFHKSSVVSMKDPRLFHESVRGSVIAELDEGSQFRGRDSNEFKAFINQSRLTYRSPYATSSEDHAVRFMLVGTTNHYDILEDQTSNRRFYPVRLSKDSAVLDICRDITEDVVLQIWAEGLHRFEAGERWSDGLADVQALAEEVRDLSTRESFGGDEIETILSESDEIRDYGKIHSMTIKQILKDRFKFSVKDANRAVSEFKMRSDAGKTDYRYSIRVVLYGRKTSGFTLKDGVK